MLTVKIETFGFPWEYQTFQINGNDMTYYIMNAGRIKE